MSWPRGSNKDRARDYPGLRRNQVKTFNISQLMSIRTGDHHTDEQLDKIYQ